MRLSLRIERGGSKPPRRYGSCAPSVNDVSNFTTIKHMALHLMRRASGKNSLRLRRKVAAWDDDFLASLIAA